MISHPLFISFDGGEGVGKSTQSKLLQERLPNLYPDLRFMFTREPGGTPFGGLIRSLILSEDAEKADANTMFGLFVADRAHHLSTVVLPALNAGKVVISDRFVAATFAYQAYAMDGKISTELFDQYYNELLARPDLTILFDLSVEESQCRVAARRGEINHFDLQTSDFHRKLFEGYRKFATDYHTQDNQVALVDAAGDVETVHERIMDLLIPALCT
ncbi:MAG: dTMP kinase [Parcubacteria bacterium C7867-008]|nr:MAG: dTMP kinase [Parcubacteria bacterium C7867-008]